VHGVLGCERCIVVVGPVVVGSSRFRWHREVLLEPLSVESSRRFGVGALAAEDGREAYPCFACFL
jgi:hypothetical protein